MIRRPQRCTLIPYTTLFRSKKKLKYVGEKWSFKQVSEYQVTAQPYYIIQNGEGEDLSNGSADYQNHSKADDFRKWLQDGLNEYKASNRSEEHTSELQSRPHL